MHRAALSSEDEPTLRIVSPLAFPETRGKTIPAGGRGARLEAGRLLADRYRIVELVGEGGMGMVYRALDEQLGLTVAVKVLRPELSSDERVVERFRRELVLARQVTHRNAVRIHDIGHDDDLLFLTMDFVEGESLQALLRDNGRLEPEHAVDIARQLALALEVAHEAGVVHRDLKPGNVLIQPAGRVCVSDFGVACSAGSHDLTRAGMVIGTPAYLSPEQAHGAALDGRSDLYALGLLLFEMLTGRLPSSRAGATREQRGGPAPDPRKLRPDLPRQLAWVVRRLLQTDPARRFQNAREVVEALDGKLRPPSIRSLGGRRRLFAAVSVSVLAVLLTAGWAYLPRNTRLQPGVEAGPLQVEEPEPPLTPSATALRAWTQGREHLLRREDAAAAAAMKRAVAADPALTAAWVGLARAHAALGQQAEALEAARRGVASVGPRSGRAAWEARALEARLQGEPERARKIASDWVAISPRDLEAHIELAEVSGEAGDLAAAVATLRRVVVADPNHPRAWLLLAKHSILAGDSRSAIDESLIQALVIQERLQSEPGRAEVYNALGVAYNDLGDLDNAAESYKKAVEIRRRIGDRRGLAASLRNLAAIDAVRGEPERAEERLAEALTIVQGLGDKAGLADLSNDLGLLAEERGHYQEAMEHYREGLRLRRGLGQSLAVAESLNNVGYVCYLLGRFQDATVYWQQALVLYQDGGDQAGVVLGTQGMGLLLMAQGDWDAAVEAFQKSLVISRGLGLEESTAAALLHLGRVGLLQGRFSEALAAFAEALPMLRELGDVRGQTELTLAEAEAWLQIGDLDATRQRLDAAERLLAGGANGEQQAELWRLRGLLHLRHGETAQAREALRRAVREAEASHGAVTLLQARIARTRLQGAQGLEELRGLRDEATRLGHRTLELQAAEAFTEAALASGDMAEAETAVRRGLDTARESGAWAGAFRLHLLLAQILERRGLPEEAVNHSDRAATELARLRNELAPDGAEEAVAAAR
jgi:tetratricopeptide (TPR) repeat protein/predicted Ser/Thr protein kinase